MIKKKDNIIDFPSKLSAIEKEIEGILFAAAEPLDVETIENKISKKTDVRKILLKLQNEYNFRYGHLLIIKFLMISLFTKMKIWKPLTRSFFF